MVSGSVSAHISRQCNGLCQVTGHGRTMQACAKQRSTCVLAVGRSAVPSLRVSILLSQASRQLKAFPLTQVTSSGDQTPSISMSSCRLHHRTQQDAMELRGVRFCVSTRIKQCGSALSGDVPWPCRAGLCSTGLSKAALDLDPLC